MRVRHIYVSDNNCVKCVLIFISSLYVYTYICDSTIVQIKYFNGLCHKYMIVKICLCCNFIVLVCGVDMCDKVYK